MELNNKQEQGLKIAVARYKLKEPYTVISGYAGTGKSTLIKFIVEALDLDPRFDVAYLAYTGKAANVLKNKGCPNAVTAHKFLYWAKMLPNGKYCYGLKKKLDIRPKLIVVDEISMLPKNMWEDLLKFHIHVIACGDPGQLPPINANENNHVLDKPHIFLDEIMRQAKESEIIRLTMEIREGKPLTPYKGQEVLILEKKDLNQGMLLWADQILCATNNKRNEINNCIRNILGYEEEPTKEDKLICLHNEWDILSNQENPLTNGIIGNLLNCSLKKINYIPKNVGVNNLEILLTDIKTEDKEIFSNLAIDYKLLKTGSPTLTPQQLFTLIKSKKYMGPIPLEFAYGYAITTWKAQGSEWKKVLLLEESFPTNLILKKQFLYTSATRATEKLIIIKK